jgi:GNAT superfamily N-acetyltransferase
LSTVLPVTLAGKRGKSRSENTIKMNFEIPFLVFHVEPAIFLLVADDPDDYIYPIYGRMAKMDNDESDIVVGKFRLYYVDIASAINTGYINMFDLFDAHSDSTADYYGSLFDPDTMDFSENLQQLFNYEIFEQNVLIIDRLELLPEYRGENLGLTIMRRLIQRYSAGAAVVAIKPFPLQFEQSIPAENKSGWHTEMQLSSFRETEGDSIRKLRSHYSKLGFIEMKGTPHMFLSTTRRLPPIERLLT